MWKACSKCGRIHDARFQCKVGKVYYQDSEHKKRSTYAWTEKSKEIREKANWLCELCLSKGEVVYKDLEVHHIEKIKDAPNLLLDNENLICLCQRCHKDADNGLIDKELLKRLAVDREKGIPHTTRLALKAADKTNRPTLKHKKGEIGAVLD